jgi:PadR family transcriptional regulator, regulatory protein AphA
MPALAGSSVSTEQLTTTEGAILALLAIEGERSAYALAKLVVRAVGHLWAPARSGLDATLPRLAKRGLLETRAIAQQGKPGKQVYRLSERGRESLTAWLETVEPGARETFFLKLFVGGLTTPDVLLEQVAQFQHDTGQRLQALRAIEPTNTNRGHDWYHRQLLRYGIERAEQDLAWADGVELALRLGPK